MRGGEGAVLGLDAGGSSTKWAWQPAGAAEPTASGRVGPLTSALLETEAGRRALSELRDALPGRPERVWAGLPGLGRGTPEAGAARRTLAQGFGLAPEQVWAESDLDLAYRAYFAPGEGLLLYAGTGSLAYHLRVGGEVVRAGGRGYRIGDDGGGASLGRGALRHLTDALDLGEVPVGPLAEEVGLVTGGLDWDSLRRFVYGAPGASALARLAPAVGRAAQRGDPVALALLEEAAGSLAELARRVGARVPGLPVIATGGALRVSPLLPARLGALVPGVRTEWRDHALTAARLARLGGKQP